MKTTSERTRDRSYEEIKDELSRRERQVLEVIIKRGPISDADMVEHLPVRGVNSVTPRRGDLVKKGLVKAAGTQLDPITEKNVTVWQAAEDLITSEDDEHLIPGGQNGSLFPCPHCGGYHGNNTNCQRDD